MKNNLVPLALFFLAVFYFIIGRSFQKFSIDANRLVKGIHAAGPIKLLQKRSTQGDNNFIIQKQFK